MCLASCKNIEALAPVSSEIPYPALNNTYSNITIPIEMDLTSSFMQAEKLIPTVYKGKNEVCEGVSSTYSIARKPIRFDGNGKGLDYTVDGELKLNLSYCPKCQSITGKEPLCLVPRIYADCGVSEPKRRFTLKYATSLKVGPDYSLNTKTVLKHFDLIDPCKITLFNYDATPKIESEIKKQLQVLEPEIDKQLKTIDIKSMARDTWNSLLDPIEVPGYGFLYLRPTGIGMSEIDFSGQKANFNFTLKLAPSFVTEKLSMPKTPLPELSKVNNASALDLAMDVNFSFDSLTQLIRAEFVGKSFDVKRKKVKVEDLYISGSKDNQLVLKTQISGSKKGTIYLLASPVLNDSLHQIDFNNVSFDVHTKNMLLKAAKWIFKTKITEMIEDQASFDYLPLVSDVKKEINTSLNQEVLKDVHLKGNVSEIYLKELFVTPSHLVLRTQLIGQMKLILK
jgi:hypothetical protein